MNKYSSYNNSNIIVDLIPKAFVFKIKNKLGSAIKMLKKIISLHCI